MQDRQIIISPMAFHAPKVVNVPHGATLHDIVASLYPDTYVIVEVNGVPISRDHWHLVPPVDAHVLVSVPLHGGGGGGGGGKNPLRTVLTIAVIVAATYVSGGALAPYLGATFAAGTMGASLAGAGVLAAGMLLTNAIAPIKLTGTVANNQTYKDSPTYSIGANSNQENPWGVVPVALGTHRVYPPLGAKSYTELVGSDEYLRMLVVWGYGPLDISDIKLGDTLLSSYTNVETQTREGWSDDAAITLFPSSVQQDSIGVILTSAGGQVTRTAQANVDELSVDISFPRGLVQYNNEGTRTAQSVTVLVQYREVGGGAWTDVETKTFTDLTTSAVRYGWRWTVDNTKQYEIGMTRTTADTDDDKIIDEVYWTYLRSIETTYPISFPHNLAVSAIRIKATDQLSGQIDNLNGVVSSYCPVWDSVEKEWGSAEADYEITNNPAALIRWVLMGSANARARTASQIDNDTLGEFYEFCETNGYAFNMYRDYTASVFETCQDIAAAARGSVTIKDGLWSVTADTGEQTLVQHITPRNSWGFSAEKTLYNRPHAFRIKFKNEDNGYEDDERIVYDDGYTSANATLFESIEFPGITDPDLIWKFGRFHIAQARLRPEMYSLYMDFEHLVCRRGDKVRVSHDIPLWGSGWGRVKSLTTSGGNITHITLDESVTMEVGTNYACRFRLVDGSTLVLSVVTSVGSTATLELQTPVAEASGPEVGDLAMFGEADRETVELLVHSIQRAGDFTAQLSLVDVATAVYDADSGVIPAFDPQTTKPVDERTLAPAPPIILATESGTAALDVRADGVISRILVYLAPPTGTLKIERYQVRYRLQGESVWQYAPETGSLTVPVSPVTDEKTYELQAQAVSIYGVRSLWTATTVVTVVGQTAPPSDVTGLSISIIDGQAHLSWEPVTDLDLSHYRIRWSPETTGVTWLESVDVVKRVGKPATSVTLPLMVGSYLIKAVDYAGNESENATYENTTVASVHGLNIIETVSQETPDWDGVSAGVIYDSDEGGLVLEVIGPSPAWDTGIAWDTDIEWSYDADSGSMMATGYYTLGDTVDLEGIFQSRLTASISASGVDMMQDIYEIDNLYAVANLYSDVEGNFTVAIEMRRTDDDPDGTPTWTEWKPLLVGDYSARAYQFRLALTGTQPNITPLVTAVSIEIDMPDRTYAFNATIEIGGTTVSFTPAFYEVPEIGLSVSDGQEGDKYTISAKDESGFTIAFTNGGNGVERTISGIAKSYGAQEVA